MKRTNAKERRGKGDAQGVLESIVDLEDSSLVSTSVAVVGCREDGDDVFLLK